jgi:hypothetical protein
VPYNGLTRVGVGVGVGVVGLVGRVGVGWRSRSLGLLACMKVDVTMIMAIMAIMWVVVVGS